ncbi:chromate transporter [Bacterioplanes sanyensis]|uniref:chromate efflux transporter n=1 Tax=Bacterioplanes sanyensis TaxID=1249553 RepID=UPI0016720890|nr:chromate efflux transporter [Bacterioplanes sanyensis]GGY35587.1 chromate transporter [Bacterioplanes sanyensis]
MNSNIWQILRQFFWLGCTSFGGPAAHIGYFRQQFVVQQGALSGQRFADLLALCQFLPGPASSQLGAAIGFDLAGWRGAIAAFVGFTLPSVLILALLGSSWLWWADSALVLALKWLAMVVVADAVWSMAQQFCQSARHKRIALLVLLLMLLWPTGQWWVLVLVAAWAAWHVQDDSTSPPNGSTSPSIVGHFSPLALTLLAMFFALLLWAVWPHSSVYSDLLALFYRTGATVFGGGHVVLPLLQPELVGQGLLSEAQFNAGYGAAQILPGPLFSVAFFFAQGTGAGIGVALSCLLAIFLPGFLLLFALLHQWQWLQQQPRLVAALRAVNAAVVGLLAATWLSVLLPAASTGLLSVLLALPALAWLRHDKQPRTLLWLAALALVFYGL